MNSFLDTHSVLQPRSHLSWKFSFNCLNIIHITSSFSEGMVLCECFIFLSSHFNYNQKYPPKLSRSTKIFVDTLYSGTHLYLPYSCILDFFFHSSSSRYLNIIREWVRLIVTIKFSLIIEFSTKYGYLCTQHHTRIAPRVKEPTSFLKLFVTLKTRRYQSLGWSSSTSLSGDYLKARCNYQRRFSVSKVETAKKKKKKKCYAAKNKKYYNNQGALIVEEVGPVVKDSCK